MGSAQGERSEKPAARPPRFGSARARMNRRNRRILILGLASTVVSSVGMIVLLIMSSMNAESAHPSSDITSLKVYVPAHDIARGTRLNPTLFKEAELADREFLPGMLQTLEGIEDYYTRFDLKGSLPVTKDKLTMSPPPESLTPLIPPGYRAVAIAVDETSSVDYWAKPGVHVDVVVSYQDPENRILKKTRVLVEDVIVLSFGRQTERMMNATEANRTNSQRVDANGNAISFQAATVTLAVPVDGALKIRTGQMMGTLSLLLRNSEDETGAGTQAVSTDEFRKAAPSSARTAFVPPPVQVVEAPAAPKERPKGRAKFSNPQTGETVQLELYGREWRSGE